MAERKTKTTQVHSGERPNHYVLQVVSDQETREELMEEYGLNENQYYDLLARFNQQSGDLQYSIDPVEIKKSLKSFLSKMVR
jgi:hypothetical protein